MAQKNKKIQLKKRSRQSASIHRGLAMPVGPGSENSLVSFRDFADLKAKYFRFTGRIQRRPFLVRTLILMVAQFMFTLILYSKIVESILIGHLDYAIIFGILFIALTIPTVWAHLSLGARRFHDLNKPGALFAVPFICYLASYAFPVLGFDTAALAAQSIMAVSYLGLATVKGTDGDNAYGPERAR
ncbi:DUF805 domain-containing protein [uncultured Megasphaera sp.]|uniref:DUF805 domain-containing protein n=1 Tax=uncultured Megasphaera sp. TaxID=165188 RepID=UPI0025EB3CD9|nr:DUF805 domain-containing protein [uncultured Megasphaera sp.]